MTEYQSKAQMACMSRALLHAAPHHGCHGCKTLYFTARHCAPESCCVRSVREKEPTAVAFDEFERAIHSPHLKAVARHWNEARGAGLMPAWQDLKPSRISGQLSIIWSYIYDPSTDEFRGRLAGDRIVQVISRNIRGLSLKDVHPETFPWL